MTTPMRFSDHLVYVERPDGSISIEREDDSPEAADEMRELVLELLNEIQMTRTAELLGDGSALVVEVRLSRGDLGESGDDEATPDTSQPYPLDDLLGRIDKLTGQS